MELTMTKREGFGEGNVLVRRNSVIPCVEYMPPSSSNGSAQSQNGSPKSTVHVSFIPIIRRAQEPHGRIGQISQRRARKLKNDKKGKHWCRCRHCMDHFSRDRIRDHEADCAMNPANEQLVECSFCSHLCHPDHMNAHEETCENNPDAKKCDTVS